MSKDKDALVLELLAKVKTKKDEIAAIQSPKWETHCSFSFNDNVGKSNAVNLQTCSDVNVLLDVLVFLKTRIEKTSLYYQVATELGVEFNNKWQNFSFDQWAKDIRTRIGQISLSKRKKELVELESRLDKLVTSEQRRDLELEAIQNLLKD